MYFLAYALVFIVYTSSDKRSKENLKRTPRVETYSIPSPTPSLSANKDNSDCYRCPPALPSIRQCAMQAEKLISFNSSHQLSRVFSDVKTTNRTVCQGRSAGHETPFYITFPATACLLLLLCFRRHHWWMDACLDFDRGSDAYRTTMGHCRQLCL